MSRYINPFPQYPYAPSGQLFFYESEQNVLKTTYADQQQTIANDNPVLLSAIGLTPNIFYSGSARVVLRTVEGQEFERDPVGGENSFADFGQWLDYIGYDTNDIVELSGNFYISTTDGNQGNDPSLTPNSNEYWTLINFLKLYNSTTTYAIGDVVNTSGGALWASQSAANLDNSPSTDDGTYWMPAVNGAKIPEVIALESRTTTIIPQTGGGALTALRVNELQDAGAYTLPLASSVLVNQTITITQPNSYISFVPVVTRSGSDTITYSVGTETSITFNSGSSISLTLTSNGVSDWRI
tara:strand:+ start:6508 stop:7398 length:891 start_codon:yes stop_codon:yes gene_type:complete